MTLYLDTSALVKVFISESNSELVRRVYDKAEIIAISSIGYVEFNSAIARLLREKFINEFQFKCIIEDFNLCWKTYHVVQLSDSIIKRAANLVYTCELRAFDSIHLCSAEYLSFETNDNLLFGCFDRKLIKAAKLINLKLIE